MANRKKNSRPWLIAVLVLALVGAAGIGITSWITSAAPGSGNDGSTTSTSLPAAPTGEPTTPTQTPEPTPPVSDDAFGADPLINLNSFCDQNGEYPVNVTQQFVQLMDITSGEPVVAPSELLSQGSSRLALLNGCDPLDSEPVVTFTPIDVAGDHCSYTHPKARDMCQNLGDLNPPYVVSSEPSGIFFGTTLPEWLEGKKMYEIATTIGFDPDGSNLSYTIPASAGVWEMAVSYAGETYRVEITIPVIDASDEVWDMTNDGLVPAN